LSRSNAPPVSDGLSIQPLFPELLLWPSILSLDAPVVAIVWQALAAHILNIRLGPYEPAILAFTIWFLYVADHLLDAMKPAREPWEPARRRFYRRHIRAMQITGICSAIALLPLAHASLSPKVFSTGLKIALTVACYFIAIHLSPPGWRERWPREAAVALIFACGTFMPLWGPGRTTGSFLASLYSAVPLTLLVEHLGHRDLGMAKERVLSAGQTSRLHALGGRTLWPILFQRLPVFHCG
jgi:hypothetical protein